MGGVRWREEHKNLDRVEVDWQVDLYDDDVSQLPLTLNTTKVQRTYHGLTREIKPGIFPSSFNVGIRGSFSQLFDDLRTSTEKRFYIKTYRDTVLDFIGRVATDGVIDQDAPTPNDSELIATDGLASLKQLDFKDTRTLTIWQWIIECFNAIDVLPQYPAGVATVVLAMDLYESSMKNFTDNPLTMTRVKGTAFYNNPSETESGIKYWDVLEQIMVSWGLRCYPDDGVYRIVEVIAHLNDSYAIWEYDQDFTLIGTDTYSSEKEIDHDTVRWVTRGNSWRYLPPLKRVFIKHDYEISATTVDETWDNDDQTEKLIGLFPVTSLEQFIKITGQFNTQTTITNAAYDEIYETHEHYYVWQIKLRITDGTDTVWFRKDIYFDGIHNGQVGSFYNPVYDPPLLATSEVAAEYIDKASKYHSAWFNPSTGLPEFPPQTTLLDQSTITSLGWGFAIDTVLEVYMQVQLVKIKGLANDNLILTQSGSYTWDWEFTNVGLEFSDVQPGDPIPIGLIHAAPNDVDGTYEELELKTRIGDAPNSNRHLQILNADDQWQSSQVWRPNSDTANLHSLLTHTVRNIMSLRRTSRRIYQGSVIVHDFTFGSRYEYRSLIYLPLSGEYDGSIDAWNGEILEIDSDDITDIDNPPVGIESDPPGIAPPNLDPDQDIDPIQPVGPSVPPGIGNLQTAETIDDVTPYTTIDIINPNGLVIAAGEFVMLFNPLTAEYEIVELAADIGAMDTTMTIISHTFGTGFPEGSPITIAPVEHLEWVMEDFVATGGETAVSVTGPLPNNTVFPDAKIWERCKVLRGGTYRRYADTPAAMHDHGINKAGEEVTFNIPLVKGEWIRIEYKIPRA